MIKRLASRAILAGLLVGCAVGVARADIAVVIEHQWTVGNNFFSAFAFNPETGEFRSGGYGSGVDFRWSQVVDDTVEPWTMTGGQQLSTFQWEIFVRDGFAANSGSFSCWGMTHCPLDDSYFVTGIGILRGYASGSVRLDAERALLKHYPNLPDSPQIMPTNCSVSNVGGVYKLIDTNLTSTNGFLASGVQVGHRVTVFPIDINAAVYAETYQVMEVLSDNELRLDSDPSYGNPVENGIGYILSMQPHVTLGTLRQILPFFATTTTVGAKAAYKGGLSLDNSTLYVSELITGNVLAVDTLVPEQVDIFVAKSQFEGYVQDQIDAGRTRYNIVGPAYLVYTELTDTDWNRVLVTTTASDSTEQAAVGTKSLKTTFNAAGAKLTFESDDGSGQDPLGFAALDFWIHGGASGGQQMDLWLLNSNGVGNGVTLDPPQANTWSHVVLPMGSFAVTDDVFRIEFRSTAGGAQPAFYLDQIGLYWTDPLPPWAGAYDPLLAEPGTADTFVDSKDRIIFTETHTDDILWTTDGTTLHTLIPSYDLAAAYVAAGAIDPATIEVSNGVQVQGLIVDQMGTVYWSDNQTRSIWKAPAFDTANHIIQLASKAELAAVLGFNPRGTQCFHIRGTELLTYNFVDGNFIYKVDLETQDYGDYDGDVDVDTDDYALFFEECLAGPNVTLRRSGCTAEQFALADLDKDGDVDLEDYAAFQGFSTGPIGP